MDYKLFWLITLSLWLILNTLHIHDLVVYKKYIANLLTFHKVTSAKTSEKHSNNTHQLMGGVNEKYPSLDEKNLIKNTFLRIIEMNEEIIKGIHYKIVSFKAQVVAGMNYFFSLKTNANEVIEINLYVLPPNNANEVTSATLTKSDGSVVKITNLPKW